MRKYNKIILIYISKNERYGPSIIFNSQTSLELFNNENQTLYVQAHLGYLPLKLLTQSKSPPAMPCKNYFLNLSRTGGVSVAHRSRFINPFYELLAQEIKFLLEHNRETINSNFRIS
jgi:hypothetical protein